MSNLVVRNFGSGLTVREASDGSVTFTGLACRTDFDYQMSYLEGDEWFERVAAGAFKSTLDASPDVVLLINHGGLPLARTSSGTLRLSESDRGLEVRAKLDASDPDVAGLLPKVRRGDMSQMSFAFRVTDQEWENEGRNRVIRSVDIDRGDVAIVTHPANPATTFDLRTAERAADGLAKVFDHSAGVGLTGERVDEDYASAAETESVKPAVLDDDDEFYDRLLKSIG